MPFGLWATRYKIMLREKNLLAHTEHSSMEFLRAASVPNQHALIEVASVSRQNPWQHLPLGIDTNEPESKFSGDAKSCDASASIGGRILSHPGRKNHGVSGVFTVASWWSRSIIRAAMQPEWSILRAK